MKEDVTTHKSPLLKERFIRCDKSPLKIRYITPMVERRMPVNCLVPMGILSIKNDSPSIKTGMEELIMRAFVAVVF